MAPGGARLGDGGATLSGRSHPVAAARRHPSPERGGRSRQDSSPLRKSGWGGWRSAGGRPGTVCGPPCFRRREPDVFSAERPRSAVTAAAERFGAGIRGRCGVCHCRPRSHYPLDPFETKPGRAGASRAPGLLRFKPEDSPFPCRRGEQPVLLHGPVPPRVYEEAPGVPQRSHPPHAVGPGARRPPPRRDEGHCTGGPPSDRQNGSRKPYAADYAREYSDNQTI